MSLIPKSLKLSVLIWLLGYAIDELDGKAIAAQLRALAREKMGNDGEKKLVARAQGFVSEFQAGLTVPIIL